MDPMATIFFVVPTLVGKIHLSPFLESRPQACSTFQPLQLRDVLRSFADASTMLQPRLWEGRLAILLPKEPEREGSRFLRGRGGLLVM